MRSKIHVAFEIGVILKGLNGLAELVGGTLLLLFPDNPLVTRYLSAHAERFAAIYLLSHGIVKGVLVLGLLREQLWAFPSAIAVFTGFGVYQIVQYIKQPSIWMIVLTVLDVFVILLTWFEWQRVARVRAHRPA